MRYYIIPTTAGLVSKVCSNRASGAVTRPRAVTHADVRLVAIIQSKNGALKAMKKRNDISCCIIIEAAEGRKHGLFSFRPDAIAAALALMSHTS